MLGVFAGATNAGVDMPARPSQQVWRQKQREFRRVMKDEGVAAKILELWSVVENRLRVTGQWSEQNVKREKAEMARMFFHAILLKKSCGLQLIESDKEGTIENAQIKSALTKQQVNTLALMWDEEMERAGLQGMQLCDDWMIVNGVVRDYVLHGEESEHGDPGPRVVVQVVRFADSDPMEALRVMLEQM